MKRILVITLPILVLLAGVGSAVLLIKHRREVKPQPIAVIAPLVTVVEARPTNHQFTVASQGTVSPRRDIQLVAEVAGRVVEVAPSLAAGGFFEEGEVLILIDPRDYRLALTRAEAQVRQAEVQLERERAEAEVARREWEALGRGEASPLLLRQPQLAEAKAAAEGAGAALEQAKLDLERCQVRAPFAGRVWEKRVDVGQYVTRGTPLARLYSVDFAEVRLPLALEDLAFLGLPVDYRAGPNQPEPPVARMRGRIAGREHSWPATITRMEGEIDPRTRMATLVAQVRDPYHLAEATPGLPVLPVGLFVEAVIQGQVMTNVFVVPRTVLRGRSQVMVVGPEDRLEFREVDVMRADRALAVIGSGIKPGDRLVNSLLDMAVEGMAVRLAEAQEPASDAELEVQR